MQYCLIAKPLKSSIPKITKLITFAKVLEVSSKREVVVVIGSQGDAYIYDIKTGEQVHQAVLSTTQPTTLEFLLQVKEKQGILCLFTALNIYLLNMPDLIQSIDRKETKILLKKLEMKASDSKKHLSYQFLMNKTLQIIVLSKQRYVKMAGRTSTEVKYYYNLLKEDLSCMHLFSFDHPTPNEHKISLNSLDPGIILYQVYTNKSRPIKLTLVQFYLYPQGQRGADQKINQITINHFFKELTIIEVFKINAQALCLFGNNCFEEEAMSLMIVFNFKEKYTLNYLALNQVAIERVFVRLKPRYKYNSKQISLIFDIFSVDPQEARYYQLTPESYHKQPESQIYGSILAADEHFFIVQTHNQLTIYPKIHKFTIYSKLLQKLHLDKSLLGTVTELLT